MKYDQLQLLSDLHNLLGGNFTPLDRHPSLYSVGLQLRDWLILIPERSALSNGVTFCVSGDTSVRVWRETNCHLGSNGYEHKARSYEDFLAIVVREVRETLINCED